MIVWILIGCMLQLMPLMSAGSEFHTKVEFAMDRRKGLNPDNRLQLSLMLFNFRLMVNESGVLEKTDLFAHANWTTVDRFCGESGKQLETYVDMDPSVVALFENKARWKAFMKEIGLESYSAKSYDPTAEPPLTEYPVVVKTNHHFGHGTHVVKNAVEYRTTVEAIRAQGHTYLVEEALTGMGLAEMSAFGSVYKGRLLSLRCAVRTFNANRVMNQQQQGSLFATASLRVESREGTSGGSTGQHPPVFVRGFQMKPSTDVPCPCGQDLVSATTQMFAKTPLPYTGPFCIDAKLDKHLKLKMMEVNARFCGSLAPGDGLFVATFVPLAYAVVEALPFTAAYNRSALYHSSHRAIYEQIRKEEQIALDTGGGLSGGTWVTVPEFNHTLTLDRPYDYYLKALPHHTQRSRRSIHGRSSRLHSGANSAPQGSVPAADAAPETASRP